MTQIPEDLKYTEDDEWVRVEGDTATIGITDYAQDQLSDIVYVEHPDVGAAFDQGEIFGVVESVKAAGDMHMPVGGEVVEVNEALEDEPEVVNSDPYGAGWFIKIKIADPAELDKLLDAAAYKAHCDARA
ncbi:MAG: glycine cleavage system protein GcvH [Anaerolineae bacterium]|nr:glycine cleavage system protein GcvH [Anaerolineae bacterium]